MDRLIHTPEGVRDVYNQECISLRVGGRHDICAIPRVNPVLEAMAALTVADALLLQRRMG